MNDRLKELEKQCTFLLELKTESGHTRQQIRFEKEKFAEAIIQECINNLEWHGHMEAVSQLNWFKTNHFGVK